MEGFVASLIVIEYRLLIPLTILRWPLAGIFLSMLADASDAMIFEATGWGLFESSRNYSYWDKALDMWYLVFALLAVKKFWSDARAITMARTLFWWRAIGVAAFFIWPQRIIFAFAPNIFENFYILWTAIRKWSPARHITRNQLVLIVLTAAIPKMIQEIMMHWLFENQTWHFFRTYVFWWLY